jgi:hypothetical protein
MSVLDLSSDVSAFDETIQTIAFHQIENDLSFENDSKTIQIVAFHQTASESDSSSL